MLPDLGDLLISVQRCRKLKSLECAKGIYENACLHGLDSQSCVGNFLVQMLAECGSVPCARQVSERLEFQNEHSWTTLILSCIDCGQPQCAFHLYRRMKQKNVSPSVYTFMALLKACTMVQDIERGHEVHADIMRNVKERDIYIGNALIDMYAKFGSLLQAREVFDQLSERDVVSWTALIGGYAEHGPGELALECFWNMKEEGITPNDLTFVCVLKACGSIGALVEGRKIAKKVAQIGLHGNIILGNSLVDMYAKCGALREAQEVFDKLMLRNLVSWNVLIAGYAEHGPIRQALFCFQRMKAEGITPDGMSWTSLIAGFSEHGPFHEALDLYEQMQREGILPDAVAYASVLKACGNVGAIDMGQELHNEIMLKNYTRDHYVGNNLIEMYAQGGSFLEAQKVFDTLVKRDICVWNTIIKACAINREGRLAVKYFETMQEERVNPDMVTFTCLLTACSHNYMVVEGKHYIKLMMSKYRIVPTVDHYKSVIDLLAQSGCLKEAENLLLEGVPKSFQDEGLWAALLTASLMYGEVEVGERCYQQLVRKNLKTAPFVSFMHEACIITGKLKDVCKVEEQRNESDGEKKPEFAIVKGKREAHEFLDRATVTRNKSDFVRLLPKIVGSPITIDKEHALSTHAGESTVICGFLNAKSWHLFHVANSKKIPKRPRILSKSKRLSNDLSSILSSLLELCNQLNWQCGLLSWQGIRSIWIPISVILHTRLFAC